MARRDEEASAKFIISTLEASETMLDEVDPDSDPDELRIELMAAGLNAIASMGAQASTRLRLASQDHRIASRTGAHHLHCDAPVSFCPNAKSQYSDDRNGVDCNRTCFQH